MKILILGGTTFIGRGIAEDALRAGHELTLFTRGRTGSDLFPGVRRLTGDRDTGDYKAITDTGRGDSWDAVIDVSGYLPRQVTQAIEAIGDRVGHYVFISTNAVYDPAFTEPGGDEGTTRHAPVRTVQTVDDLDNATYGASKTACEDDIMARFGDRATIVRPGQVTGPGDPDDRLVFWLRQVARGGRIALPGDPEQPVQVVDVRDLARLVARLVEDGRAGVFNAVGPAEPTTLTGIVQACAAALGVGAEVELVPVALPDGEKRPPFPLVRDDWFSQQRSAARALAAGMPTTPLVVTVADTLAWDRRRGEPPVGGGFTTERELELLAGL
jgi:2'-hydroxyisoflavone reductase